VLFLPGQSDPRNHTKNKNELNQFFFVFLRGSFADS